MKASDIILDHLASGIAATPRFIQRFYAPQFTVLEIADVCGVLVAQGKLLTEVIHNQGMVRVPDVAEEIQAEFRPHNLLASSKMPWTNPDRAAFLDSVFKKTVEAEKKELAA